MDAIGQIIVSTDDAVIVQTDPNFPDEIAEEVVIDPSGGSSESVHFYQSQQEGIIEGIDTGNVVEVKDDEITYDDGSEEMSVAIDLAKLSQGHFSQRENLNQSSGSYKIVTDTSYDGGSQYVFYTEDGKQAQCLEDIEGRTVHVSDTYSKPRMSYAQLIAEALMNAEEGMLTLSEIYQAISAKHPYYRMDARNWQNSIRHNLTLNKCFSKVPRQSNEGRGSYWKLESGAESIIFKRNARQHHKVKESFPTIVSATETSVVQDAVGQSVISGNGSQQVIYVTIPTN